MTYRATIAVLAVAVTTCLSGCISTENSRIRENVRKHYAEQAAMAPQLTRQYFGRDDIRIDGVDSPPRSRFEQLRWYVTLPDGVNGYMVYTNDAQLYFRRTYHTVKADQPNTPADFVERLQAAATRG